MTLTPCSDLSAASWIAGNGRSWQQLADFGPPGFPAYARLRFLPDPAYEGQSENDVSVDDDAPSETAQLRAVLEALTRHTRTPGECYFCLWDGWGWTVEGGDGAWTLNPHTDTTRSEFLSASAPSPGAVPGRQDGSDDPPSALAAPKVVIPHRAYFLFHGTVSDLGDWGGLDETRPVQPRPNNFNPAFIWPADHAWCIANDVDPHWAGIGAGTPAIDQLVSDPFLDVVPADPHQDQPRYR